MILLKQVTIIDSTSQYHQQTKDILINDGIITKIENSINQENARVITTPNLHVSIGWFDTSVSFGEPGFEDRQSIKNGLDTAAHSGFTTLLLNPNNQPNPQEAAGIQYLKNQTKDHAVTVYPVGNFTQDQKGKHLAQLYDMHQAGVVSYYDFKKSVTDTNLLKIGLQYIKSFNGVLQSYPQDNQLAGKGLVNEDKTTIHLGIKTMPSIAEEVQIARDLQVAQYTGARLHIPTITTAASVQLIKKFKKSYNNVTCSVSVNHLLLNTSELESFDTRYKLQPPLRSESDRKALVNALKNGTIDTVTSDHMPCTIEYKNVEFDHAQYGSIGLESAYGAVQSLLTIDQTINALTTGYNIFGVNKPVIKVDNTANLSLFVPDHNYLFSTDHIQSSVQNSALLGKQLVGKPMGIINNNKFIWNE